MDDSGELHIYDGGSGGQEGRWLPTGTRFALDDQGNAKDWIHLAFRQDYEAGVWDVVINGRIFRANLLLEGDPATLETIELIGQSNTSLYVDNLTVSRDATAFSDLDRDGLPDDWEMIHGLDINGDRDADPDADGLSNVEELVLGTSPTDADTDGDGASDGDEYEAQTDPLQPSEREVAASSATSGNLTLTTSTCGETWAGFSLTLYGANIGEMIVYGMMADPHYEALSSYNWVYYGSGEIWLTSSTFVGEGRIYVDVHADDGNTYYGSFGFSCSFCGCLSAWDVGSVDFKIGIGANDFGQFGQDLAVNEATWTEAVYSRSSVRYAGARREGRARQTIVEIDGKKALVLDWVRTDTQFTKLVDLPNGYAIEAYHLNQVAEDHSVTGQPFKRHRVENPDPQGLHPDKRLRITEEGARNAVREYRFHLSHGVEQWELFEGSEDDFATRPLRYTKMIKMDPSRLTPSGRDHLEVEFHQSGHWDDATQSLVIDEEKELTYQRFAYGKKLVKEVLDPHGQALTTHHGYAEDFEDFDPREDPGGFAQIRKQWTEHPDGAWEWYGYDQFARRNRIVRPVGNEPRPDSLPEPGPGYHVTLIEFDPVASSETITEIVEGATTQVITKTWQTVGHTLREETRVSYGDDAKQDLAVTFKDALTKRLIRRENPDGTIVTVDLKEDGDLRAETRFEGAAHRSYGTETYTLTHRSGLQMEQRITDVESGVITKHEKTLRHDDRFRPLMVADQLRGEVRSSGYDCCDLEWETRDDGTVIVYDRDVLGRVIGKRQGYKNPLEPGNVLEIVIAQQRYQLDGKDRRILTRQIALDGSGSLEASETYNLASQLVSHTSLNGVETREKTIMLEEGGRLELTSLPRSGHDDRHRISSRHYDASDRLVRQRTYASRDPFATKPDPGTLVGHHFYEEGRDQRWFYKQVSDIASIFDRRVTRTYFNARGQPTEVIYAFGTSQAASEHFDYRQDGQLIRHVDLDGAITRHGYNERGERVLTAIDLKIEPNEAPDHIDPDVDRVARTITELVTNEDGLDVRRVTNEVFTENGPAITSIQEQSLDGTYSSTMQNGRRATRRRVQGDQLGQWTITVTQPGGRYTVWAFESGHLARSTRHASDDTAISWTEQQIDAYGRPWQITDSRTGTTTLHYDENGRLWKTSAPDPKTGSATGHTLDTIYHFDALGQAVTIVKPGGGEIHRVYSANGTLHRVHGHHTTDVEFRYNGRAERTGMITYYGPDDTPAHTRWHFNVRGQLAFKQDAAGKRVYYTYTPGGKLKTRTWARGIVITYHYDPENHVDLRTIDYSDGTPDAHFAYTRLGQKKTVKDAGGLVTYAYHPEAPFTLISETRHGRFYGEAKTITYTRDELNRSSGFQIGTAANPAQDYAVRYGYDMVSRLGLIAAQGYEFQYGYLPHSTTDRVKTLRALFVKETGLAYEPGRDAIASITNRVGFNHDQLLSQYGYATNADGQRTSRTTTHGDDTFTDTFGFDPDTGGLIASERTAGDDRAGWPNTSSGTGGLTTSKKAASPDNPNDHAYAYDKIGNRELAVSGAEAPIAYQPNALNQYVSIEGHSLLAPTHDADGNLTRKGDRTFAWDAENRLISIHERGILIARYTYDYQSRRIARWTRGGVDERYLYQGWNLIAVYSPNETKPTETYTWGKDLSGSTEGAGGVGGLLFAKKRGHGDDAWIYHYDANGNVTGITDSEGNVLDRYQYDPFGNLAAASQLPDNRFRFSTKPQDAETGFYYYGYRYYDPETGRWPSKDPIGEGGGMNLYGFVGNDGVNQRDLFGLEVERWEWFSIVSKTYINGVGELGSLPEDMGHLPLERLLGLAAPNPLIGALIAEIAARALADANTRLSIFATAVGTFPAFNQNPKHHKKDGKYRLYTRIIMQVCCVKGKLKRRDDDWSKDAGLEVPLIYGTIWLRYRFIDKPDSFQVVWTGWGRPNILVEPGMQWVGHRNDRIRGLAIWHEGTAKVTCDSDNNPQYKLESYMGSQFPSRKVWFNGVEKKEVEQDEFADLWTEHPTTDIQKKFDIF